MGDGLADSTGTATWTHEMSIPATPHGVRAALLQVRGLLCADGLHGDDCGTVETVLAEVLNNIVEHAYANGGDGDIGLTLARAQSGLAVQVTDTGAAMPGGRLPAPQLAALDGPRDDLPEGGFGWALIRDLTVGLDYRRTGGTNRLRFRVPCAS